MTVETDKVVSIAYTLRGTDGEVIDSSDGREDLDYLHGHQNIVRGLESALAGKGIGDEIKATVPPEQGYGERRDELVFRVPRSNMPDGELNPGMQFAAQDKEGNQQVVTLVDVGDDEVTLDANHPLAGQVLQFDVKVTAIREATSQEIDHGHVHDPEAHHH